MSQISNTELNAKIYDFISRKAKEYPELELLDEDRSPVVSSLNYEETRAKPGLYSSHNHLIPTI